jgi:tRNA1Val (adenine37-N6)-methyltransferase
MPKDLFRFKQFTISQTGTTLKVCTDSCLLGAWVANSFIEAKNALDIGTGTGLLALMVAQKHLNTSILALEIDEKSAALAKSNFKSSPWSDSLKVENSSLQDFSNKTSTDTFEIIFCNPPFFENQLTSSNQTNNLAKHSSQLTRQELANAIFKLLIENGSAFVLLPEFEAEDFVTIANGLGLFLTEQKTIRNKPNETVFRQMMRFEKIQKELTQSEIVIYETEKVYTQDFTKLLKPYYLYL